METPNEASANKEEALPKEGQPSLEDMAAHEYRTLLPSFRTQIDHLSGKQAKKVLVALMEYPLEKIDFDWNYKESQRAFITGATIMDCRFVLMKALVEMSMEEKKAILDETKDDVTTPKEGELNGSV
jgi:hypothetical protein